MSRTQLVVIREGEGPVLRVTRLGEDTTVVWYLGEDDDLLTRVLSSDELPSEDDELPEGYSIGGRSVSTVE